MAPSCKLDKIKSCKPIDMDNAAEFLEEFISENDKGARILEEQDEQEVSLNTKTTGVRSRS